MDTIRVVLADDHAIVRGGIRALLARAEDVAVVGEAATGEQALQLVATLRPDVLVLDVEMPGVSGAEVVQRLRESGASVRVLVLSAYDADAYVETLLKAGVAGYLIKDEAPDHIVEAVRGVARGETGWLSRRVTAKLQAYMTRPAPRQDERLRKLTPREWQVWKLRAAGLTNRAIGERLFVSAGTVKTDLSRLKEKLGLLDATPADLIAAYHRLPDRDRGA